MIPNLANVIDKAITDKTSLVCFHPDLYFKAGLPELGCFKASLSPKKAYKGKIKDVKVYTTQSVEKYEIRFYRASDLSDVRTDDIDRLVEQVNSESWYMTDAERCDVCKGKGKVELLETIEDPCEACEGDGILWE